MESKQKLKTPIDLNREGVSLVVPRVFPNINSKRIKKTFIESQLGIVDRVDVVSKGRFNRAYVHFKPNSWNIKDKTAREALEQLSKGKQINLEYDTPWFWKVSLSKARSSPSPSKRKTIKVEKTKKNSKGKRPTTRKRKRRKTKKVRKRR